MFIRNILKEKETSVSFEIFPPKENVAFEKLLGTINELSALRPDFMSVTYGAGGGTSKNTLNICKEVQARGVTALAHLTCVSASKDDIASIAAEFKKSGIENILALRGDKPADKSEYFSDYAYAGDLIADLKTLGDFCIGGACYPEGHLESKSLEEDVEHIKEKVDAGCEFLITQLYFDNECLYRYRDMLAQKNVSVPIIAGLMPVRDAKQIERLCKLSGASIPKKFRRMMERYADDPPAMAQAGIAYVTDQAIDLYAGRIDGIHIYTMNRPDVAKKIISNISLLKK